MGNTYTISVTDQSGGLACAPTSLDVKIGDTVVWSYEEPKKFYISLSSGAIYQSTANNGHQSFTLVIATGFSFPARYNVGLVGQSATSSSGGVISCTTCPH